MSESSFFETTYSQDQRIEQWLEEKNEKEREDRAQIQENRSYFFQQIFSEQKEPVFFLPGLHFVYYTHKKIKFYFRPYDLFDYVSRRIKFYCKLVYYDKYGWWTFKKDTLPANWKNRICSLFFTHTIIDETIIEAIEFIYRKLVNWSEREQKRKIDKYRKYRAGEIEDLEMLSDDQEIFFDESEKEELRSKRNKILKRMLPPDKRENFEEIEREIFGSDSR